MNHPRFAQSLALGILGAIVGGVVGYYLFFWIARQGFYAIMLPGWLLGYSAAFFARQRSMPLAVICTVLALVAGFFTEWKFSPDSFKYFVAHLHKLKPLTLIMIALGAFLSYRSTIPGLGSGSRTDIVP
jgi:hypothetical protein